MAYLRSFFIIFVCLMLGKGIQHLTGLAIPGSIIGMLILFTILSMGLIPAHWAMQGCHFLIRHMALLFVPVGIGLINYLDLLTNNTLIILLSTIGSSVVVFVVIGLATHYKEKQ
ncbi:CidA/LrgA family protein [Photobacterium rosenbergii]|uniref:CidA/LrgA family protein n=1 Tax=Photobacterium rosenbergii TaxID=294936 RepID=A0ABU3ZEZ7_9GAMM|nr:CidA/LrgA family protein [Photobacterium rosenbergii]MDV5168670.1 CidA/LrgA family protein [Photobacterium rosenbergii]